MPPLKDITISISKSIMYIMRVVIYPYLGFICSWGHNNMLYCLKIEKIGVVCHR